MWQPLSLWGAVHCSGNAADGVTRVQGDDGAAGGAPGSQIGAGSSGSAGDGGGAAVQREELPEPPDERVACLERADCPRVQNYDHRCDLTACEGPGWCTYFTPSAAVPLQRIPGDMWVCNCQGRLYRDVGQLAAYDVVSVLETSASPRPRAPRAIRRSTLPRC